MRTRSLFVPFVVVALVAPVAVLGALFFAPAPAAAPGGCTKVGTSGPDSISGTGGPDFICARGGDDYVHAQGGNDTVLGEGGGDTLVGGAGRDDVRGNDNDDRIFVVDQVRGNDKVNGGMGVDQCYLDLRDTAINCEQVTRGLALGTFEGMDAGLLGLVILAEEFQDRPTETSTSPQCTPPPEESPASCP